jgi:glucokinase
MQPETPWLVADIGGTNARFALVHGGGRTIDEVASLRCADYAGPQDALRAYLDAPAWRVRGWPRSPWQRSLQLERLLVINDFAALVRALPALQPAQYRVFAGPAPAAGSAMAVIGPGTGLGVAAIVPSPRGWIAVPSEGGHATLSADTPFELEVLQEMRRRFAHVSAERVVSGIGLPALYESVAQVRGEPGQVGSAAEVTQRAIAGEVRAAATLDMFCALLGGFAGNVALTFAARGGVFIGGGIAAQLGEMFFRSPFRDRFESKGRFTPWLREVATPLITAPQAALLGAAAALAEAIPSP